MFLREFGLSVHPFGISPRLEFLYKSGAFEESIAHLVYGLDNSEAIVVITGAIGTGKTMAVQSFLSYLGDRYVSALVTNTSVDAKELLKLVLEDLDVPLSPGADKSDLLIAFKKFLIASGRQGKRIIVVVDEAQNLSREALEEIRLLTNLGQGDEQPVQIVLVGQPELEAALQRPDLAQLRQRIRVHYKLAPLSRRELQEYVDHRMTVAGGTAGVFTKGALDRIWELSGGVPRVVNTLCGEALLAAHVAGRRKVEDRDLEDRDLEDQPAAVRAPGREATDAAPHAAPVPAAATSAPAMAVRRDVAAGRQEKAKTPRSATNKTPSAPAAEAPARRRRNGRAAWIVAALAVAVAALAATGRLDGLWSQVRSGSGAEGDRSASPTATTPEAAPDEVVPATVQDGAQEMRATPTADSSGTAKPAPAQELAAPAGDGTDVSPTSSAPAIAAVSPAAQAAVREAAVQTATAGIPAAREPAHSAPDGEFYVHVSSFRKPEQAASAARKLTELGLLSTVHRQMVRDVQWHRVYMGPYGTHDAAVRLADRLRDEGTITYYKVIQMDADDGR